MDKEYYNIEDVVRMDAKLQLMKTVKKYGLEMTEDKIKELYKSSPTIIDYLLDVLYKDIWHGKQNAA